MGGSVAPCATIAGLKVTLDSVRSGFVARVVWAETPQLFASLTSITVPVSSAHASKT